MPSQHESLCYDFIYTPVGDPFVEGVMAGVRDNNAPNRIPPERVLGLPSVALVSASHPCVIPNASSCYDGCSH